MDIRKYMKTQQEQAEQQEGDDEVSSRKKQKTKSDDSVVTEKLENRPYDSNSSSDIANAPSLESEVKQDDTATGEVDGPNMSHKYSFDSDTGVDINSAVYVR